MNDEKREDDQKASNDTLTVLLNLAGPSPNIDKDVEDRVYANVRNAWSTSKTRSWSRPLLWALPVTLAASVLVVFGWQGPDAVPRAKPVASIVLVADPSGASGIGDHVYAGDVLDTSNGHGLTLALDDDISLRIDAHTLLKVDAANEFTLLAGQIYIDSGDRIHSDRHVTVMTAIGVVKDIGTQFSVRFDKADLSVAVREGRLDLSDGHQTHSARRGDKVTIRPGQSARFESVPIDGDQWNWAVALAPSFDIENRSLLDFLKWSSRELGMELVIESNSMRIEAMRSRLHGSVDGMSPLEAIDAVMSTTKFDYSIDDGAITIHE